MRSLVLVLALLVVSTGCKTTGGKIFGTLSLASAVGGGYLTVTSSSTIQNGMLVTHDDRQNLGVGLVFAAGFAAIGWAVCEMVLDEHSCGGGGGGGYSYVAPAPAVAQVAPAPPAPPAPPPAQVAPPVPPAPPAPTPPAPPAPAVAPADPIVAPDPARERASGEPVVVVQGRDHDKRDRFSRGWRFDPLDGQDKLYAPSGKLIGRIDARGDVWDGKGALVGRVAMGPSCEVACMRSQADKMLRGIPLNH